MKNNPYIHTYLLSVSCCTRKKEKNTIFIMGWLRLVGSCNYKDILRFFSHEHHVGDARMYSRYQRTSVFSKNSFFILFFNQEFFFFITGSFLLHKHRLTLFLLQFDFAHKKVIDIWSSKSRLTLVFSKKSLGDTMLFRTVFCHSWLRFVRNTKSRLFGGGCL